jgi:hypothetical protein
VRGLKGLSYLDKSKDPNNPTLSKETRDEVTFGAALVDSVYVKAPEHVELDVGTGEGGVGWPWLCVGKRAEDWGWPWLCVGKRVEDWG